MSRSLDLISERIESLKERKLTFEKEFQDLMKQEPSTEGTARIMELLGGSREISSELLFLDSLVTSLGSKPKRAIGKPMSGGSASGQEFESLNLGELQKAIRQVNFKTREDYEKILDIITASIIEGTPIQSKDAIEECLKLAHDLPPRQISSRTLNDVFFSNVKRVLKEKIAVVQLASNNKDPSNQ